MIRELTKEERKEGRRMNEKVIYLIKKLSSQYRQLGLRRKYCHSWLSDTSEAKFLEVITEIPKEQLIRAFIAILEAKGNPFVEYAKKAIQDKQYRKTKEFTVAIRGACAADPSVGFYLLRMIEENREDYWADFWSYAIGLIKNLEDLFNESGQQCTCEQPPWRECVCE